MTNPIDNALVKLGAEVERETADVPAISEEEFIASCGPCYEPEEVAEPVGPERTITTCPAGRLVHLNQAECMDGGVYRECIGCPLAR